VFDETPDSVAGGEAKWLVDSLAPNEVREYKYALPKAVSAQEFAQPAVEKTSQPAQPQTRFFDANLWPYAAWTIFLSLVAFTVAQIHFAERVQKRELLEGPRGYRKRRPRFR
jgi:hypothetical protein